MDAFVSPAMARFILSISCLDEPVILPPRLNTNDTRAPKASACNLSEPGNALIVSLINLGKVRDLNTSNAIAQGMVMSLTEDTAALAVSLFLPR